MRSKSGHLSNKVTLEQRKLSEKKTLYIYNDKKVSPTGRCSNPKYVYINNRVIRRVRQKLIEMKEEIDKLAIRVGDFKIFLSSIDR